MHVFLLLLFLGVFELLHEAAFRNALGNSLYVEKYKIGKFSSEQVYVWISIFKKYLLIKMFLNISHTNILGVLLFYFMKKTTTTICCHFNQLLQLLERILS